MLPHMLYTAASITCEWAGAVWQQLISSLLSALNAQEQVITDGPTDRQMNQHGKVCSLVHATNKGHWEVLK